MLLPADTNVNNDVHQVSCCLRGLILTFINFKLQLNRPAGRATKQFGEGGLAWQRF
jgi:hypothetical protein